MTTATYWVDCSCGWEGPDSDTHWDAEKTAEEHLKIYPMHTYEICVYTALPDPSPSYGGDGDE